jgi:hypothetical protein
MTSEGIWWRCDGDDLVLKLRIQPRATRDELAGLQGDRLRVRLRAPPVDGKANAQLQRFVADLFQVSRQRVLIEAGLGAREKRVRILGPVALPESLSAI